MKFYTAKETLTYWGTFVYERELHSCRVTVTMGGAHGLIPTPMHSNITIFEFSISTLVNSFDQFCTMYIIEFKQQLIN